jgi:hypothetical protein
VRTLLLLIVILAGCPSTEPEPVEPTPAPGPDLTLRAGPGEARAGLITEDIADQVLFAGIASEGQAGDTLLFNDRVRFVVQGPRMGNGYVNTGGHVIDADLVRPEGQLGRDVVEDLFLAFGIGWLFHADTVEVVQDGADGGSALVRATGRAQQWTFIAGVSESPDPIVPDPGVVVTREYELPADSWALEIRTRFENDGDEDVRFNPSDGWMAAREDVQTWATNEGLDPGAMEQGAAGEAGRNGEGAFGLWRPEGALDVLSISGILSGSGILIFGGGWSDLEPGGVLETTRTFALAADANTVEAVRMEGLGEPVGAASGRVLDPSGAAIAGARVHFYDDAMPPNVAGYAVADEEGSWQATLRPGTWTALAVGSGGDEQVPLPAGAGRFGPFVRPGVQQRTLDALDGTTDALPISWARGHATVPGATVVVEDGGSVEADVPLGGRGAVRITLRDGAGDALPGYVEFRAPVGVDHNPPIAATDRAALGLPDDGNTILAWFAGEGTEIAVPPGTWDVHLEGSFRHERVVLEGVDVPAGSVLELEQVLEQRIPFDGWVAVDSHLHAAPSGDGSLPMEDRLLTCAASGIQVPVTTDHDASADYRPLGTALGLDSRSRSVPGLEVSPVVRGHFNMFPFTPDPTEPNNGAEPWWEYPESTDDLMERMRIRRPDAVIQVNHGRSGMFDLANFIRPTGQPAQPNRFSWNWDVFELAASQQDELQADFFTFLDMGQLKTPMGVSDSHGRTSVCGKGRTDVMLGVDDPRNVTHEALRDAILAGHVVVSRGVTLRASVGESLPGDVVTSGDIAVTVQALPWMRPTQVRLWRNGVVLETRDTAADPDGATYFDESFVMESDTDAWFIVEALGGGAMGGIWGGTGPWAMTNAFLFDADGDGWTAPRDQ